MSRQLFDELLREFWTTSGVMTFSQVGIKQLVERIQWEPTDENPDPKISIGAGDPNDLGVVADASWPKSLLDGASEAGGWLQQWLTHAWLALIYARWEAYYRPELAKAHGVSVANVRSDVIGDVRHLRNDVIHHLGLATKSNAGRCKILQKFNEGDVILLTPTDVRLLRDALQVQIEPETNI